MRECATVCLTQRTTSDSILKGLHARHRTNEAILQRRHAGRSSRHVSVGNRRYGGPGPDPDTRHTKEEIRCRATAHRDAGGRSVGTQGASMTPSIKVHPVTPEKLMHQALQVHRRDERNRTAHRSGDHGTGEMHSPARVPTCPLCKPDRQAPEARA